MLQDYILRKTRAGRRKVYFDISCQNILGSVFRFPDQINLCTIPLKCRPRCIVGRECIEGYYAQKPFRRMQYLEFKPQRHRRVIYHSITTDLLILVIKGTDSLCNLLRLSLTSPPPHFQIISLLKRFTT